MKFALFGADQESLPLAQAAVEAGHQIVWGGDVASAQTGWDLPWLPEADLADQWEELLELPAGTAVIVGRGEASAELRADQVIQLVKNGATVLTTFPLVDLVLSYYEIDMVRCESGALLQHFNPLLQQLEDCARWIAEGHPQLGSIEQVVWHRPLEERTREQTLWHFTRDVELLDQVVGGINRLGALGSPDEQATYAGLSIQLLGKSQIPVRWEVGPVEQSPEPRLMLIAKNGSLKWSFNEVGRTVRLDVNQAGQATTESIEPSDPYAAAIRRFAEAAGRADGAESDWPQALHAMELTDTIEISLRRGRMIDIHDKQLTEDMAFKGTMSAAGCGVLLILPPLLLTAGWIAELLGLSVAGYWPHALLFLLAVFLLLQFLPSLFQPPKPSEDTASVAPVKD